MTVEVTHKGYAIRYSENEDVWRCYDIDFQHPALTKVRQKVDDFLRAERKANAVAAIKLSSYGETTDATISEVKPIVGTFEREPGRRRVYWTGTRKGSARTTRQADEIKDFAPDTPEARKAIEEWQTAERAVRSAEKRARERFAAIPRLSEADLAPLHPEPTKEGER